MLVTLKQLKRAVGVKALITFCSVYCVNYAERLHLFTGIFLFFLSLVPSLYRGSPFTPSLYRIFFLNPILHFEIEISAFANHRW